MIIDYTSLKGMILSIKNSSQYQEFQSVITSSIPPCAHAGGLVIGEGQCIDVLIVKPTLDSLQFTSIRRIKLKSTSLFINHGV